MSKRIVFLSGVSVLALGVAGAAASGLPTGGKFSSGKGSITTSGASITVKQSSTSGVINWKTFSVGSKNSIAFDNGSGATLNKVTGKSLSTIAGSMTATGSLYLMNSQGVIVSGTGKIVTGGTFIATSGSITTDSKNSEILDIAGAKKKVANAGSITSSSGNVFLIGNSAANTGTITAKKDDAVVAAASKMALILEPQKIPAGQVEQQIEVEAGTGNAVNSGTITGATAEVAAYSGEAEANSSKKAGTISALGAKNDQAAVWVISTNGKTSISGSLKTAAGGAIETIGTNVGITGKISAGKSGRWDWYADSITVNNTTGALINTALKAGTNVSVNTYSAAAYSNLQGKNIVIDAPISWSTNATFSIVAFQNIVFDKNIDVTGAGTMSFQSFANNNYGEWVFNDGASMSFGTKNQGAKLNIETVAYKLIYSMAQMQNINNNLGGSFALATSLVAGTSWIPIGTNGSGTVISTPDTNGSQYGFFGNFDGLGHTISDLTIDLPTIDDVGLFGYTTTSTVRDVALVGGSVIGNNNVGGLIGDDDDFYSQPIEYVSNTGSVQGNGDNVGGLIGLEAGPTVLNAAYATGTVSGATGVGGLVGVTATAITNSYATGAVSGTNEVGGLLGAITDDGSVSYSYATGAVGSAGTAGGLIGEYGDSAVTDGYWDTETSGQATSAGGLGLTTTQLEHSLPAGFSSSVWDIVAKKSMPYLLSQAPNTGSRPKASVVAAPDSDELLIDEMKRWRS
jgi:filamentous hemagglutinin family protein